MIREGMCRVSLYAPETDRLRWAKLARKKGTSLSRLLYAAIEEGLAEKPDSNFVREVGELREKIAVFQEMLEKNLAPGKAGMALGLARGVLPRCLQTGS